MFLCQHQRRLRTDAKIRADLARGRQESNPGRSHHADPTHASRGKRTLATIFRALAEHHNKLENLDLIGVVVGDTLGDQGAEKRHKSLVGATRHPAAQPLTSLPTSAMLWLKNKRLVIPANISAFRLGGRPPS